MTPLRAVSRIATLSMNDHRLHRTRRGATVPRPAGVPRTVRSRRLAGVCIALLVSFAFSLSVGCGEDAADGEPEEMTFEVDPNLLGPAWTDSTLGITVVPPQGFQAASDEFMANVKGQMPAPEDADEFFVLPEMVFAPPASSTRLFVSRFMGRGPGPLSEEWIEGYLASAAEKAAPNEIESDRYLLRGRPVLQVLIQGEFVNRRLVSAVEGRPVVQVDYLVPRTEYADRLEAIESSIGSLERF